MNTTQTNMEAMIDVWHVATEQAFAVFVLTADGAKKIKNGFASRREACEEAIKSSVDLSIPLSPYCLRA